MTDFFTTLFPLLLELLVAILVVVIPLATAKIYRLTGIKIEAVHRDALHSAIQSGITAATTGGTRAVTDLALREAVAYAKRSVPDAIAKLDPSDAVLMTLAERYAAQIKI